MARPPVPPLRIPAAGKQQPGPALQPQGSSIKVELSNTLADEPFEPHKPTAASTVKLLLWFGAVFLLVGAIVGLSVTMVIVQHNRDANSPPSPPPPPFPPGTVLSPPPPPPGSSGGGSDDGPGGNSSTGGGSSGGGGAGPPVQPPASPPFSVPSGWKALWWDEFDGSTLDTDKWSYDVGNGNWGWGNNETEYYTSSTANVNQQSGRLSIVALRDRSGGWTSGRINTLGKAAFYPGMQTDDGSTYGNIHIEASIQVPNPGQGLWPAFWLYPVDLTYGPWPASGEIDVMECINDMGTCGQGLHYGGPPPYKVQDFKRYPPPNGKPYPGTFHTFAVDWSLASISLSIDGKVMKQISAANQGNGQAPQAGWWTVAQGSGPAAPFDKPFYIILNLAVGGLWPGYPDSTTPSPSTMQLEYIRVWGK